jgi:leucine dehydrogenase
VVTDVNPDRRELAGQLGARWVARDDAIAVEADVLAPCALGGLLDEESAMRLRAPIIAGAANNQLADDAIADLLAARGILWAPDFVVNAGGLINVAEELHGYDPAAVRRRVSGIADTLRQIFDNAQLIGATPLTAAMELARRRLAAGTISPVPEVPVRR